jgi:hypothetical protein
MAQGTWHGTKHTLGFSLGDIMHYKHLERSQRGFHKSGRGQRNGERFLEEVKYEPSLKREGKWVGVGG